MSRTEGRPTLGSALRIPEFRAMWAAEALSQAGDQLARVALSVLVYERTSSAGLTGLAYGLTYLPTLVGGTVLARLADRYPRRSVMVACDLLRLVVAAVMAIPGTPFPALCLLLVVLTVAGGPFRAAQLALLPTVLPEEDSYLSGLAVRNITIQSAQVAGFALGGLAIAVTGPYWGLVADAVTFAASAALVRFGVRPHPAAESGKRSPARGWSRWFGAGAVAIRAVPGGIALLGLKMLAGLYVLPEGLAAPYAAQIGSGTVLVGLILAADPVGAVLGAWLYAKFVPYELRPRLIGWLAAGAGVPLVFLLTRPPLLGSVLLIAASGLLATPYQMQATARITQETPNELRGQVSGLTSTALVAVQGLGIVLAGALAQATDPATTIGYAALAGVLLGLAGTVAWSRATARHLRSSPAR